MGVVRHGGGVPLCELSVGCLERRESLVDPLLLVKLLARARRGPSATRRRADRRPARLALQGADQPADAILRGGKLGIEFLLLQFPPVRAPLDPRHVADLLEVGERSARELHLHTIDCVVRDVAMLLLLQHSALILQERRRTLLTLLGRPVRP